MTLPTNRTIDNTKAEHVADHNITHGFVNDHPADPAAHSGTLAPVVTQVFLPAPWFFSRLGVEIGNAGVIAPVWRFDSAVIEQIVGTCPVLPSDWATFNVNLQWTNVGAGTGDVVWRFEYERVAGVGDTLGANTIGSGNQVATAPLQNVVAERTMASGVAVPAAGKFFNLLVHRRGNEAADTLGNDAGFIGLMLTKAS